MTMHLLGTPRPDIAAEIKRRMLAAEPGLRETDLTITVHDTIVSETARIVLRPPTTEEMAQIKIAEGINEATNEFPSAQRLWPLTPGATADGGGASGPSAPNAPPQKSAEILAKPMRGPGEGADASPSTSRLGLGIPEAGRLVSRPQSEQEL